MDGYLGETVLNIRKTEYALYSKEDWVMYYVERYGGIDGDHHKTWLLDQIARILKGAEIQIKVARWSNGHTEDRINIINPTEEYHMWVEEMKSGEDGPDTYDYDVGIAP